MRGMTTVGDFLLQRLSEWGVRRVYGYPGDGINGIMGALDRSRESDHPIELVQVRHRPRLPRLPARSPPRHHQHGR